MDAGGGSEFLEFLLKPYHVQLTQSQLIVRILSTGSTVETLNLEKFRIETGMWQMGSYTGAFQACSSPPLSKDHSRWQRGEKIALGPAARKADHSQRETDPVGGSCSSFTNPTGKGLLGGAAHSPTPPLGSRDQNMSPNVPGCNSWCLPSPPSAVAFPEHGLGKSPSAQGPAR